MHGVLDDAVSLEVNTCVFLKIMIHRDAPSAHLRFYQARQHVVDFVHSYRFGLALPNRAPLSLLVSLYYI